MLMAGMKSGLTCSVRRYPDSASLADPFLRVDFGHLEQGQCVTGIQPHRLPVMLHRAIRIAAAFQHHRQVIVGLGVLGEDVDHLPVQGGCTLDLPGLHLLERLLAQRIEGLAKQFVFGIEGGGLFKLRDHPGHVSPVLEKIGSVSTPLGLDQTCGLGLGLRQGPGLRFRGNQKRQVRLPVFFDGLQERPLVDPHGQSPRGGKFHEGIVIGMDHRPGGKFPHGALTHDQMGQKILHIADADSGQILGDALLPDPRLESRDNPLSGGSLIPP